MTEEIVAIGLAVLGVVATAAIVLAAAHVSQMHAEERRRYRQYVMHMAREGNRLEAERIRQMNWLHAQAYGRPKLTVVDGGRAEDCAVIPFPSRDKD